MSSRSLRRRGRKLGVAALAASMGLAGLGLAGAPAGAAVPTDTERLNGDDRYETAAAISAAAFDASDSVVLATGLDFADALAGNGLAGALDAPILLTGATLEESTAEEIDRLGAETVYIMGGTDVLSEDVEDALGEVDVVRVAGAERWSTAVDAAEHIDDLAGIGTTGEEDLRTAILVNGLRFPDAVAASPAAFALNLPVLLTEGAELRPETATALGELDIERVLLVGGSDVVSNDVQDAVEEMDIVVSRYDGDDRWATAVDFAERFLQGELEWSTADGSEYVLATAEGAATGETADGFPAKFADALTGGPYAGSQQAPMLLTPTALLDGAPSAYLTDNCAAFDVQTTLGGVNAVSATTEAAAASAAQCGPDEDTGIISGTVTVAGDEDDEEPTPAGGPFVMHVESGSLAFGVDADEPYAVEFTECVEGVPAEEGAECISLAGEIDDDGNVTIAPSGVSFPAVVSESDSPIGTVDVRAQTGAAATITGTIDPDTGDVDLELPMEIVIDALDDGDDDCRVSFTLNASSDADDGAALVDGRFSAADVAFAVGEAEEIPGGLGALACGSVNDQLNLPSDAGENAAVFNVYLDLDVEPVEPVVTPIPGATVTAVDADGVEHTALTNASGSYAIEGLAPGDYDVTAEAAGYLPQAEAGQAVVAGEVTNVDFALEGTADPQLEFIEGDEEAVAGEWAYYDVRHWNAGDVALDETFRLERTVLDADDNVVEEAVTQFFLPEFLGQPFNQYVPNPIADQPFPGSSDGIWEFRVEYPEAGEYTFVVTMFGETTDTEYASDSFETTVEPAPLFEAGEFTLFVESGSVVIGTDEDEPYVIDFVECPDGVSVDPERECITFSGTIDEDGDFTVLPEDVFFPQSVQTSEPLPGVVVTATVQSGVSAPITGTVDPLTGEATADLPMLVHISLSSENPALDGHQCEMLVGLDTTTGDSGAIDGAALADDRLSLVDGEFAVGEAVPASEEGDDLCALIDGTVGLPSPSGANTALFNLLMVQ